MTEPDNVPRMFVIRRITLITVAACLLSACHTVGHVDWTDKARKPYASAPATVMAVERWRSEIVSAFDAYNVDVATNLDRALVVMACESKGNPDARNGGLYQFTTRTWARTSQADKPRTDPAANVWAMAETVARSGWHAWAGGRLVGGVTWGSGPKGHRCWRY